MGSKVYVIGAGLSGLAAAVALAKAGYQPIVAEAGPQAGGRCRSYFDKELGCRIDNGNHLLLSGNRHALDFLDTIGACHTMRGAAEPRFPFIDLTTNQRWELRPNLGKFPWWLFVKNRRVPDTKFADYFKPVNLARAKNHATIAGVMDTSETLFRRLWDPLAVSGLNIDVHQGSARLFWAIIKETLGAGGKACRPLIPELGLSESFIDPAIAYIEAKGGTVQLKKRLHQIIFTDDAVTGLDFGEENIAIPPDQSVVLSVPAPVAAGLILELSVPQTHTAIVNLHYKIDLPLIEPGFIGIVGGTAEWVFQKPGVLSVTISAADRFVDYPTEELAQIVWEDLRKIYDLPAQMPLWRVVKEKRATFAATPAEDLRRPQARTKWRNLVLAGDWTATGLPSTIEGSIRSGHTAARIILKNT